MYNEEVVRNPYALGHLPDHLKTKETCNEVVCINPVAFFLIPDCFKTQEMYNEAVEVDTRQLHHVPDHLKVQEIYDATVREDPSSLIYVPDWFVTQPNIKLLHTGNDYDDDDNDKIMMRWHFFSLLVIHQDGEIGACQKTRKRDKKNVEVTDNRFEPSDMLSLKIY